MVWRFIYNIVIMLLFPVVLMQLLVRAIKQPEYRQGLSQRLGLWMPDSQSTKEGSRRSILIHAVSVGETMAAKPLVDELLQQYPDHKIWITNTTPTGYATTARLFSKEIAQQVVRQRYLPYDLPFRMKPMLRQHQAELMIVMETELWPNLFHACNDLKIPLVLANARLSERSMQRYLKFRRLTKQTLNCIDLIACRDEHDLRRFIHLGADSDRTNVIGNLKFDVRPPTDSIAQAEKVRGSWVNNDYSVIWVVASTHPGEDEKVLAVFAHLKAVFPALKLVLVPRHPERFDGVYQMCLDTGFSVSRRSLMPSTDETDILLGDSMGEMFMWFALADIVFMGGSLVETGGHNPLEPAVLGKPIITGSHIHNFEDVYQSLKKHDAVIEVNGVDNLVEVMSDLLTDENKRESLADKVQWVMSSESGVTQRLVDKIRDYVRT